MGRATGREGRSYPNVPCDPPELLDTDPLGSEGGKSTLVKPLSTLDDDACLVRSPKEFRLSSLPSEPGETGRELPEDDRSLCELAGEVPTLLDPRWKYWPWLALPYRLDQSGTLPELLPFWWYPWLMLLEVVELLELLELIEGELTDTGCRFSTRTGVGRGLVGMGSAVSQWGLRGAARPC